jgi:hypothetical protein
MLATAFVIDSVEVLIPRFSLVTTLVGHRPDGPAYGAGSGGAVYSVEASSP